MMKSFAFSALATALVFTVGLSSALAAPVAVQGDKTKAIEVSQLLARMGKFDPKDAADFAGARKVIVYHVPDAYAFDDYEKTCSAYDTAGLDRLHKAFADDPQTAKWFEENGYKVTDLVAVMHNPADQSFEIYLR